MLRSAYCIRFVVFLCVVLLELSAQAASQEGITYIDPPPQQYEISISPPRPISDEERRRRIVSGAPCRRLSQQQIAQNEIAAQYLPVWEKRIKAANGFDDAAFDRHIVVTGVQDRDTTSGHTLGIDLCIKPSVSM